MTFLSCSSNCIHVDEDSNHPKEWTLTPGQQQTVTLLFVPEEPSVLYHGEVMFQNVTDLNKSTTNNQQKKDESSDVLIVNARGYGGSSNLIITTHLEDHEEREEDVSDTKELEFGLCSMGTSTVKCIAIENVGLLESNYTLSLSDSINASNHFYLQNGERGKLKGTIQGKSKIIVNVVYDLTTHVQPIANKETANKEIANQETANKETAEGIKETEHVKEKDNVEEEEDVSNDREYHTTVLLQWSPVVNGTLIKDTSLSLHGGVGYVNVMSDKNAIDYGTMFVKQYKTKRITLTNYGNTSTTITATMDSSHKKDR